MPVHPSIAAGLLSWAAATDNREVTKEAAIAWSEALDDRVTLADGKAAISAHRSTTSDYLMPSHVNAGVRSIRKTRLDNMQTPQPPEALDGSPAREMAWQREYRRAIGDGATEVQAMQASCAALGVDVPVALPPATRPPELTIAKGAQCEHGCLEKPVRAGERL